MITQEGQHVVTLPLFTVRTAREGAASNEQLVPGQEEFATDGTTLGVNNEAVAVFAEGDNPPRTVLVGGERIAQTIVDKVAVDQLGGKELGDALLIGGGGHQHQFTLSKGTGKTVFAVRAQLQLAGTVGQRRTCSPQLGLALGRAAHEGKQKQ